MRTEFERGMLVALRYRLERLLGQGGMGVVWEARHLLTQRPVAIKFLRGSMAERPEMRRRFLLEARAASLVNHPNVIKIHEVLEIEDQAPAIVMSLLWGMTLGQRLARETSLPLKDAADILIQVVAGTGAAHAQGIVHRDLKPDNVFITDGAESPSVQVLDFGIAKLLTDHTGAGLRTAPGASLGTPCYMSPEQAFGERKIDHRADIWSIGAIFYEAISGARPVEGASLAQVMKQFTSSCITPIDCILPDLPKDLVDLIMRMLARDRSDRPGRLEEARSILARYSRVQVAKFGEPLLTGSAIANH